MERKNENNEVDHQMGMSTAQEEVLAQTGEHSADANCEGTEEVHEGQKVMEKITKTKQRRQAKPVNVEPARQSTRLMGQTMKVAEKAEILNKRNLEGNESINSFSILDNV